VAPKDGAAVAVRSETGFFETFNLAPQGRT
jgi:hypothetical protein